MGRNDACRPIIQRLQNLTWAGIAGADEHREIQRPRHAHAGIKRRAIKRRVFSVNTQTIQPRLRQNLNQLIGRGFQKTCQLFGAPRQYLFAKRFYGHGLSPLGVHG